MKTILTIISSIVLFGCSADSERQSEPTPDCNCSTVKQADTFSLPNGYVWTVATLENDCTGVQSQKNIVGSYSVGDKVCN